jgi:hypothetical protein
MLVLAMLFGVLAGYAAGEPAAGDCPVTLPNQSTPPGQPFSPRYYGNGKVWTVLWRDGHVIVSPGEHGPGRVLPDGSLAMKFPWWRGVPGKLKIQGARIDGPAPAMRAIVPDGYGEIGFQSTELVFPREGCWRVIAAVGSAVLEFNTLVTLRIK